MVCMERTREVRPDLGEGAGGEEGVDDGFSGGDEGDVGAVAEEAGFADVEGGSSADGDRRAGLCRSGCRWGVCGRRRGG